MGKAGIWGSPWSLARHRAPGTIIRLGLHRSLLHGPLIWQTTTSKLIRARLEGAALGMERCWVASLPSWPSQGPAKQPWELFQPSGNRARERFTSKQLSTPFLPCFEKIKPQCPKDAADPELHPMVSKAGLVAPLGS